MKPNNYFLKLLIFAILTACFSCKKSTSSPTTTIVEYEITPMNVYFIKIAYNDNAGNTVEITDPSQFIHGAKSISISTQHFNAKLETTINNTTNADIDYVLVIKVDGEIKKNTQVRALPMATFTSSVEYTIQ